MKRFKLTLEAFFLAACAATRLCHGGEMIIAVGSTNKVKIEAVQEHLHEYPALSGAKVVGISAASDVSEQPMTLEETLLGAKNRAQNAFRATEKSQCSVGIEGGIFEAPGTRTGFLHITACSVFEPIPVIWLRRFSGLFWPIFDFFRRGHIRKLILPLRKKLKIGSKEPKNRQKHITGIGS